MPRFCWKLALTLLLGACGSRPPNEPPAPRPPVENFVDVDAENLAAEAELDALLKGEEQLGSAGKVLRIAVPPWVVLGSEKNRWMGEASAEYVGAELGRQAGTSVVQRGELLDLVVALKKSRGQADTSVVSKGKLVGADLLVTGTMLPGSGDGLRCVMKAVRVEDATLAATIEFQAELDGLDRAIAEATAKLRQKIGMQLSQSVTPPVLERKLRQLAARARERQYEGRLLDAQPSFAAALEKPSDAFAYEADYMRLMNDLGMLDWTVDRATRVLARMPRNELTVCARARILTERVDASPEPDVKGAREAVRAAASCGDPAVIARALSSYSFEVVPVHYPAARLAAQRARDFAKRGGAYASCEAEFQNYWYESDSLNDRGSREARWLERARACTEAGNVRVGVIGLGNAALFAWSPNKRLALRREAVELAKRVGGSTLDGARRALAKELRDRGQPSAADSVLLESIGARVRALVKLNGGLADPEARMDKELLARAQVPAGGGATRTATGADALVVKAHRIALGALLGDWALRTKPESKSQAAVYQSIARELNPPTPERDTNDLEGEKLLAKRLTIARLALASIEARKEALPRSSGADLGSAFDAIWSRYFELRAAGKATLAERKRLLAAAKKIVAWRDAPRDSVNALRLEALVLGDEGKAPEGVAVLRSARTRIKDGPTLSNLVLANEAELSDSIDARAAAEARRQRIETAKRLGPTDWIQSIFDLGYAAVGRDADAVRDAESQLLAAAEKLESEGAYEPAAMAWERSGQLQLRASHAQGSSVDVERYQRRARVLDRLNDPLRSLTARADVLNRRAAQFRESYRDGAQRVLNRDLLIATVVREMEPKLRALVAAGQARDAVRVVVHLPATTASESLITSAIEWANSFEDSAEQPVLVGRLYAMRATLATAPAARKDALAKSREAYARGGDLLEASWQAQRLVRTASSEAELHEYFAQCLAVVEKQPAYQAECIEGLAAGLYEGAARVTDRKRYTPYVAIGLGALAAFDRRASPAERRYYRTEVAIVAAVAGDLDTVRRLDREVRDYYTKTAPDPYKLVGHLGELGHALRRWHPDLATETYLAFANARGSSSYWNAGVFFEYADTARRAGNTSAEAFFLREGRSAALQHVRYLYHYEVYPARAAIEKSAWRDVEKAYTAALAALEKQKLVDAPAKSRAVLGQALARAFKKDAAGALRALRPELERIESGQSSTPCFDSELLSVAAAFENARNKCESAEKLRVLAASVRARCTGETCTAALRGGGEWCDKPDPSRAPIATTCKARMPIDTELFPL